MIIELIIKNFAIIEDLTVPFGPGLNVLTGETGAGKSIIIAALSLVVGDRVAADVVRSGEKEAEVTAVFDAKSVAKDLTGRLEQLGYFVEEHIALKRVVSSGGKSRAFLNGKAISLGQLKSLSPFLLEIASQHEHQRLLNEGTHLEFVDRFGSLNNLKNEYGLAFDKYNSVKNRVFELENIAASKTEQKGFLTFQIGEIDAAALKNGEEEELNAERNMVRHSANLFEKMNQAESLLYSSEPSVSAALNNVGDLLADVAEIDGRVKDWLSISEQAVVAVEELSRNLQLYLESMNVDPARIDQIEERLYEIRHLKKKYGDSIDAILNKRDELAEKLDLLDNCEDEIKRLNEEVKKAKAALIGFANKLSNARAKASENLSGKVQKELDSLGLKKTTFAPGHMKLDLDSADESGIDRFSFLISPNPGEPLKPLSRIASGGELSRIMLAIKSVLLDKVGLAALEVFDEVDVGIGGANAEIVGMKLSEMSASRQIICITHLPQVASYGNHHVAISKEIKGKRTVTRFRFLNEAGRVNEIARMLGGVEITRTTREHAKEMLKRSKF